MLKRKLKVSEFYFVIYYVIFIIALFAEDIAFRTIDISPITKVIKGAVAFVLILVSLSKTWKKSLLIRLAFGMLAGFITVFCSGDFFWLVVILMGFVSYNVDEDFIFKTSLYSLSFLTLLVLLACGLGLIPDTFTYRTDMSNDIRHSYGFIHSSILPLILFYLMIYYVKIKGKIKKEIVFAFVIISFIVFKKCQSRNAFYFSVLLSIILLLLRSEKIQRWTRKIILFFAKITVTLCMIFSIIPGYMRYQGMFTALWYAYDAIFTNRTLLASAAIESYGIHLLNRMDYTTYMSTLVNVDSYKWSGIVLDSAYLYILVRYGALVLLFLWFVFGALYKKYKNNLINCIIIILLAVVNMTDNDILSYSFLPFMLVGIQSMWESFLTKDKRKKG